MDNNTPNTNNFLNWVEIKNFKSIKDLRFDCKRVNVFIGKPNAGKSNILEALGLLGPIFGYKQPNYLADIIRYEELADIFNDNNTRLPILVKSNKSVSVVRAFPVVDQPFALVNGNADWFARNEKLLLESPSHLHQQNNWITAISNDKVNPYYPIYLPLNENGKNDRRHNPLSKAFFDGFEGEFMVKKYDYKPVSAYSDSGIDYLMPPDGENLFTIIDQDKELRKDVGRLFEPDKLEFVLSKKERKFYLQKKEEDYVYLYPYSSVADTFQRFMFYLAAIESNSNSVLVLEEPEVHSFPPYTQEMAYRIIYDEDNQYFTSTHSPYFLHPFIENMDYKDLNVFVTYYQDYQTRIRALTEEEFRDILDYSTNVFFNLDRFTPDDPTSTITTRMSR